MECRRDFWHQKTRVPGLSYGIVYVILGLAMFVQLRLVTDGETDGQTDRRTISGPCQGPCAECVYGPHDRHHTSGAFVKQEQWEQSFPPVPSPSLLPTSFLSLFPSLPSFPSLPDPSPPLRSRTPLIAARGSGERLSSPSRSGRSPAAKRFLVHFELKIMPPVTMVLRRFLANQFQNKLFYIGKND